MKAFHTVYYCCFFDNQKNRQQYKFKALVNTSKCDLALVPLCEERN